MKSKTVEQILAESVGEFVDHDGVRRAKDGKLRCVGTAAMGESRCRRAARIEGRCLKCLRSKAATWKGKP